MEMGEHCPSWGKPAKLPIVLCERPLSHLGAWLAYGAVWWEWAVRSGGLRVFGVTVRRAALPRARSRPLARRAARTNPHASGRLTANRGSMNAEHGLNVCL